MKRSKLICGTYIKMVRKLPALFGFIYNLALLTSTHRFKSVLYYVNKPSQDKLYDYIVQNDYDTVVLPHLFSCGNDHQHPQKQSHHQLQCYAIATDHTCIPFWEDLEMDRHRHRPQKASSAKWSSAGWTRRSWPLLASPCRRNSPKPMTRPKHGQSWGWGRRTHLSDHDRRHGVRQHQRHPHAAAECLRARDRVVVLGGRNKAKSSCAQVRIERKLQVVDFTTEVERYMAVRDVLFTAGRPSTSEAATMACRFIHTKPIPAWNRATQIFSSLGMSIYEKERARDGAPGRRAGRRRGRQAR